MNRAHYTVLDRPDNRIETDPGVSAIPQPKSSDSWRISLAPTPSVDHALALSNDKAIVRENVGVVRFGNRSLIMRARQVDRSADILRRVKEFNSIWRSVTQAAFASHFLSLNDRSEGMPQHLYHRGNTSEIKAQSHTVSRIVT